MTQTYAAVVPVGTDTTTGANWRTAAALEADNQYGTDGYVIYGIDDVDGQFRNPYLFNFDQVVLPTGITGVVTDAAQMWSGNGNFGTMEDPGNGNAITNTPLAVRLTPPSTFTISRDPDTSFRLTLLAASGDSKNVTYNNTVDDGSGGVLQSSTHTSDGLHYHVFDISSGNSNVVVTTSVPNGGSQHFSLTGLAFDSVPPPPPTVPITGNTQIGIDINAASAPTVTPNWNSFTAIGTISTGSVVDLTGTTLDGVSIDLSTSGGAFFNPGTENWAGLSSLGGSAPPEFVNSVTNDFGGTSGGNTWIITLDGLNTDLTYDIYGVTMVNAVTNRIDTLTVQGDVSYGSSGILRSDSVLGDFHTFLGVSPDNTGTITITVSDPAYGNPIISGLLINAVPTVIPEPSTLAIWSLGLLGLIAWRRRRR
jgi:hypothetical protein